MRWFTRMYISGNRKATMIVPLHYWYAYNKKGALVGAIKYINKLVRSIPWTHVPHSKESKEIRLCP